MFETYYISQESGPYADSCFQTGTCAQGLNISECSRGRKLPSIAMRFKPMGVVRCNYEEGGVVKAATGASLLHMAYAFQSTRDVGVFFLSAENQEMNTNSFQGGRIWMFFLILTTRV